MNQSAVAWLLSKLEKIKLFGQTPDEKIASYQFQRNEIIQQAVELEYKLRLNHEIENYIELTDDEIADGSIEYQKNLTKYLDNMQAFKESISFMQGAKWYRQQLNERT